MGKLQDSGVCPFPESLSLLVCRALCDTRAWKMLLETRGFAVVPEQPFPSEQPRSAQRCPLSGREKSQPFLITPKSMRGTATLSLGD